MLAAGLAPQSKPNFSGEWVLTKDRSSQQVSGAVTSVNGLLGETFTAIQDSKMLELVITVAGLAKPVRAAYHLDGRESPNFNPRGPGLPDEPIFSTVSWIGSRLEIKTRGTVLTNGKPTESTRMIWIDPEGLFIIERSSEGQPTTRSVYSRAR